MKKVDFFIAGEPKCGTTTLHALLAQHPAIAMSGIKEPRYFATDQVRESDAFHGGQRFFPIRTEADYHALFSGAPSSAVLGESSTNYLQSTEAAANIRAYNPAARIIAMFREPVDHIHSYHQTMVRNLHEDEPDFRTALGLEAERRDGRRVPQTAGAPSYLYYRHRQMAYAEHLERFLATFPREQIKVLLMDDLRTGLPSVYRDVLEFLGVDADFVPEFTVENAGAAPRFQALTRFRRSRWFWQYVKPWLPIRLYGPAARAAYRITSRRAARTPLDAELRRDLMREMRPRVEALQALIGRDLVTLWGYDRL